MKNILYIFLLFCISNSFAQTITPQVINSAGGNWTLTGSGITISDNIGEPFVSTISNSSNSITQGFLQNVVVTRGFSVSIINNDVSCKDKTDGNISTYILTTNIPTYSAQYIWEPQYVCPLNNCSSVSNLKPGTYTLTTKITYTIGTTQVKDSSSNEVIINDKTEPCKVLIYSGITPNGDGVNDGFTIDNIENFTNNRVMIFNRWGKEIFVTNNYDNKNNFWPTAEHIKTLVPSTYFYIIDLGDGSQVQKGWVELITN